MLLLALLTTLFFGDTTLPDTTKKPTPRARPAIGLFYMTGPRAYGTEGNMGLQISKPIGSRNWRLYAGLGGYLWYNEEGNRMERDNFYKNQLAIIPITYRKKSTLALYVGASKAYCLSKHLHAILGGEIGYCKLRSTVTYKNIPNLVERDLLGSDSVNWFNYSYYYFNDVSTKVWISPTITAKYLFSKCIDIHLKLTYGALFSSAKHTFTREDFDLRSNTYTGYNQSLIWDPFRAEFIKGGMGGLPPYYKPSENKFDIFGFSSLSLILNISL